LQSHVDHCKRRAALILTPATGVDKVVGAAAQIVIHSFAQSAIAADVLL